MDGSGLFSGRASGIFADVPSARENSVSLKLTFLLVVIMFMLELILMFHKDHFYNALVYVSIFAIVLLGYFDKYYIKWVMGNLVVSIVFDLLWVFLQSSVLLSSRSLTGIPIRPLTTRPFRLPSSASCTSSSSSS
jgi:hypothetical protein